MVRDKKTESMMIIKQFSAEDYHEDLNWIKEFSRESNFCIMADQSKIGVKVLAVKRKSICGLLVTEPWDLTLADFLHNNLHKFSNNHERLTRNLKRILKTLREHRIVHCDLLPKNLVCRIEGNLLTDLALIDFGLSVFAREISSNSDWPNPDVLIPYIQDKSHWNCESFITRKLSTSDFYNDPYLIDEVLLDYLYHIQ